MTDSLTQPLNKSIKESVDPTIKNSLEPSRSSLNQEVITESMLSVDVDDNKKLIKRYKVISRVGLCCLIIGLILFLAIPPIMQSLIVQGAIDQAILSPDNQNFWAHFPGQSQTIITRNYSFFNLTNEEGMLLYGEKPKFRQIEGYIITELEDYLNITYSDDMAYVSMIDWLHFDYHQDSRSLDQNAKVINVPSMGYWFLLKNSRDPLVFIEGFSLLFNNIEQSIIQTVLGQGISAQYLTDYQTTYVQLLQPAGISKQNAHFIWNDEAYGLSNKNNLKYWVEATQTSFVNNNPSFSTDAINLKDYFTLSDSELSFLITQFKEYIASLQELIFDNHYCLNITQNLCDGRQLAIRQIASAYVTQKTPPVSSITPTDTICTDNVTCIGYYPELYSYYNNVYMKEHPESDPFLKFQADMVRKWLDYNPERIPGQYNKAQSALLHIGNLDALFGNGTCYDDPTVGDKQKQQCLSNIMNRFELPSPNHTKVFWNWIKYIMNQLLRQGTKGNQILGIGQIFTTGFYKAFAYLQDNLQETLLNVMLRNKLKQKTCDTFIATSLKTDDQSVISSVCNHFGQDVSGKEFVGTAVKVCREKFGIAWGSFRELGVQLIQMESFCDIDNAGGFGQIYDSMRVEINDFYNCDQTPNKYCSDFELAIKQWANSSVTLSQPPSAGSSLQPSSTFSNWNKNAYPFEFYHYTMKFPEEKFPVYTPEVAYKLMNFDNLFSATHIIGLFKEPMVSEKVKDYMRYVSIFVGLRGFTKQRTAKQLIFGYNDQYLLERKNNYPPFGGDPSTPAYTAFNDVNISKEQAVLKLEWHTGKADPLMVSQYKNINGLPYLTTNYTRFNGNQTYSVFETPWAENDFFYGTSGKQFSPDQPNNKNVSIYVPNLQRYGSGSLNESIPYERYGYDLSLAKLGDYIYEPGSYWPDNKKYYQNYYGVFNETSVLGFPFFMTKHHFMNCTSNWTNGVEIYNEDGTIHYKDVSLWDDSYVIVEPYSGVSFQSIIYLQANYYYEPDELFTYNETIMLPVFSVYRSGNLTEAQADKLFSPLNFALNVKTALFYVGIVVALGGVTSFGYGLTKKKEMQKKMKGENAKEKQKKGGNMSLQKVNKPAENLLQKQEPQMQRQMPEEDPPSEVRPIIKQEAEQKPQQEEKPTPVVQMKEGGQDEPKEEKEEKDKEEEKVGGVEEGADKPADDKPDEDGQDEIGL